MSPLGGPREQARNLFVLRRLDDAREAAARVLSENAEDAEMLRLLADIELADDNHDLAREHAMRAVRSEQSASSYLMVATVERRTGDYAAAITACERGLQIDPEDPRLQVTVALSWSGPWLGTSHPSMSPEQKAAGEHATTAADRALELDPTRPLAHYAAAVAALVRNDPLAAATVLERGLELDPEWAAGHLLMGGIRGRQGMVKLASRHLAIAGRLAPYDDVPLDQLRSIAGNKRGQRNKRKAKAAWWIAPEARSILEADAELGETR